MISPLHDTNSSQIARELLRLREVGGAIALGRVLTLIVVATTPSVDEDAIQAAIEASAEHPMRVIVVHTSPHDGDRLDAEIRIGSDTGASEVVVLHANGNTATDLASLVQPLLLPDIPVVTWWPNCSETNPSRNPLGQLAHLRIVDSFEVATPFETLSELARNYSDGDTNLAWARITRWRAQLAAVLDQPPYTPVLAAKISYRKLSTSTVLMAAWLRHYLEVPVSLHRVEDSIPGHLREVRLRRDSGDIVLRRTERDTAMLSQPDQPDQIVPLAIRNRFSVLSEELRSLAADPIYATVLSQGVPALVTELLDAEPIA